MAVAEARHFRVLDQDRPARAGGPRRIRARCSVAPAYCPRPPRDLSLVASAPQRTDPVAPGTMHSRTRSDQLLLHVSTSDHRGAAHRAEGQLRARTITTPRPLTVIGIRHDALTWGAHTMPLARPVKATFHA